MPVLWNNYSVIRALNVKVPFERDFITFRGLKYKKIKYFCELIF